jgi:hypothetical protein
MTAHTHYELATDWDLWRDYIDPDGVLNHSEFLAMSHEERVALIVETFGPEEAEAER